MSGVRTTAKPYFGVAASTTHGEGPRYGRHGPTIWACVPRCRSRPGPTIWASRSVAGRRPRSRPARARDARPRPRSWPRSRCCSPRPSRSRSNWATSASRMRRPSTSSRSSRSGSQSGTWAAIATALISFLAYDLLLTQPRFSLVVSDPREWLDLLLFLFVAIAIGRLVAIQHGRAEESDARAREASSLFAMSRLLATADSADQAAPELARRLAADAGLRRVWIAVGDHGRQAIVADTDPAVPIPASAVLSTLVRTPGDEPARWVRTHEAGRGKEPLGGGLQVLKVRIETSSGDGSAESSGVLGSIGASATARAGCRHAPRRAHPGPRRRPDRALVATRSASPGGDRRRDRPTGRRAQDRTDRLGVA